MWTDAQQERLDDLRQRAQSSQFASDDQHDLDRLLHELERAEWETLRPSLGRIRAEQIQAHADFAQIQAQNAVLGALADRYSDLLARAKVQLDSLMHERDVLRTEYV